MGDDNSRLGNALFLFGVTFALFQIGPTLLTAPVTSYLVAGELVDFFTPLAVMSSLYLVYLRIKRLHPVDLPHRLQRRSAKLLLALGGLLYVDGHGMHLSANAIGRLAYAGREDQAVAVVYWFDEVFSHHVCHIGVILILLGLLVWSRRLPRSERPGYGTRRALPGALVFGFAFAVEGIEGQTVAFTLPAAGLLALLALLFMVRDRRLGVMNPVAQYLAVAGLVSVILFTIWGIWHPGFVQFSELGWIR